MKRLDQIGNMIPRVGDAQRFWAHLQRAVEIGAVIQRFHLWLPSTRISDAQFCYIIPVNMEKLKPDVQAGYDSVAEYYANEFFEELARKPFDCQLLDTFAEEIRGGVVCELGCGPGQVARYLKDRGVDMRGIDLSPEMVRVAGNLNPDISFSQGDMSALDLPDNSLAAFVLFYSIIHIHREQVTGAFKEMGRVLIPGGKVFLAFHGGEEKIHRDEWYGHPVSIDFRLFQPEEMAGYLDAAGFKEIKIIERDPYEFEHPTKRIYMFASNGK